MQLLRKATFMQHLMLGPPAIVANKWARRVLCVGWMAFEVYSAYRAIKTQPKAEPVILYRHPDMDTLLAASDPMVPPLGFTPFRFPDAEGERWFRECRALRASVPKVEDAETWPWPQLRCP